MDKLKICPMCGQEHKVIEDEWGTTFCCEEKNFNLYNGIFSNVDDLTKERWMNAIYNYLEKSPLMDY